MKSLLNKYLPQMVYWAVDGTVTTFAVVAGATGGDLTSKIIIILGLANLFADGASMSISAYLSAKSDTSIDSAFWRRHLSPSHSGHLLHLLLWDLSLSYPMYLISGHFSSRVSWRVSHSSVSGLWRGMSHDMAGSFSAVQTLALGTVAALIAYYVGVGLAGI
jgi:VIT1/CCC1 family predicted Fe2+/Mn2+ transporter